MQFKTIEQYEKYKDDKKIVDGIYYIQCKKCWEFKHPECFSRSTRGINGRFSYCKKCQNKGKQFSTKKYYDKLEKQLPNKYKHQIEYSNKIGFSWNKFHKKTSDFIKYHNLRPKICPICWNGWRIIFHHINYKNEDNWEYGLFCCQSCHDKIHKGKIKKLQPIYLSSLI